MVPVELKPWNPSFAGRVCFTCGAAPKGSHPDGSPLYGCTDEPGHVARTSSPLFFIDDRALKVTLTAAELRQAETCAQKRIDKAEAKSSQDRLGYYSIRSHRLGALGERAFAKWAGLKWKCGLSGYGGKPDIGGVQVRAVHRPDQRLVVHTNDPPSVPVVLVLTHRAPEFEIRGWIDAYNARREEWLDDPGDRRPSYFVPQDFLRDPTTLIPYIRT